MTFILFYKHIKKEDGNLFWVSKHPPFCFIQRSYYRCKADNICLFYQEDLDEFLSR